MQNLLQPNAQTEYNARLLRTLTRWSLLATLLAIALCIVVFIIYPQDLFSPITMLICILSAFLQIWSLRLLRQNKMIIPLIAMSTTSWIMGIQLALFASGLRNLAIYFVVIPVLFTLPFLSSRGFLLVIAFTINLVVLVGVLGLQAEPPFRLDFAPPWVSILATFLVVPFLLLIVCSGLWQYSHRLNQIITEMQAINTDLKSSEQTLEARVLERTTELEEARLNAESASLSKSIFLAQMSHEFRTPLNAILGFVQLLNRDRSLNAQQLQHLSVITRSGEHLLDLINNLLEVTRLEAGKIELNNGTFNLYNLLKNVEQMIKLRAENKGLHFETMVAEGVPTYITADEAKLRQVLINLLSNAVKFTFDGFVISRVSRPAPHCLLFEIEDSGLGISAAEQVHLFEPFVQTASGKQIGDGSGLGLSISRQYARLMKGDITTTSQLGVGSVFSFTVEFEPVQTPQVPLAAPRKVRELTPGQPVYRVLICHPSLEFRQLVTELLRPVGFETAETFTSNEIDLSRLIVNWFPQILLVDPGLVSHQKASYIKQLSNRENLAIIAVFSEKSELSELVAGSNGYDDYVLNPFTDYLLFEKIALFSGAKYTYDPEHLVESLMPVTTAETDLAGFGDVSTHDLSELRRAARQLNPRLTRQAIDRIGLVNPRLADALNKMAADFRFDKILKASNPVGVKKSDE